MASPTDTPAALITGSSTGIGRACALELDRRGWTVFAGVRREEDAKRLRADSSGRLVPVDLDVTLPESIAAAAEQVAVAVGQAGLAGLVNNAGIAVGGALEFLLIDRLREQFDVDVFGPAAVTQAVLPLLRAGKGRIVNISSVSGSLAAPYMGPYAASKFALEALSDSLRLELRRSGVSVSLIAPGPVDTPIWEKSKAVAERLREQLPAEARRLYGDDLEAFRRVVEQAAAAAVPAERVVRAVVHALTASRPKSRYFLRLSDRVTLGIVRALPDRLRDWLVLRGSGLR
jgi:NAD(P)-dependent dehydrogenase (short-subunit alcohol dehydrogenase family)